jgi:NAD(P)-dependent dehydrogenase (short-subunit alcohol dehydrogenase family)
MTKSILILAAERGLGLGLAQQFFGRGWFVVGTARAGADMSEMRAVGGADSARPSIATIDVTQADAIEPF